MYVCVRVCVGRNFFGPIKKPTTPDGLLYLLWNFFMGLQACQRRASAAETYTHTRATRQTY